MPLGVRGIRRRAHRARPPAHPRHGPATLARLRARAPRAVSVELLPLREATYERHALHGDDRCWSETNCYVDAWIEVLNSLGLEPCAAGAFTLSSDFLGDQWTFFKYPTEDLRALYG